jgi:hypothetical protein
MKKLVLAAAAMIAMPAAGFAQDQQAEARVANLEVIVVTAQKTQPADFKPDAKTAALMAEIEKETNEKVKK